ncbi:hypothetical protein [Halonotius terrestris]|nr:hypothetical protein [Halonotius terrestris]
MAADESVPFWWIVLFLLLTFGAAIGAINALGGSILLIPLAVV